MQARRCLAGKGEGWKISTIGQFIIFNVMGIIMLCMMFTVGIVYSIIRTAGGTTCDVTFYERDKLGRPGEFVKRRFRDYKHFFYRFFDTLQYSYPAVMVLLFRSISPAFREKIIINISLSNSCVQ